MFTFILASKPKLSGPSFPSGTKKGLKSKKEKLAQFEGKTLELLGKRH
jgi:hypothetical protein